MIRLNCLQVFFLRFKATSYNNQEDPQQSSTLPRSLSTTKTISQHFNNMFKTNSYHRSLTKTTTALPRLPATPILPKPTFDKPKPAAGRRYNNIMTQDSCLKLSLSSQVAQQTASVYGRQVSFPCPTKISWWLCSNPTKISCWLCSNSTKVSRCFFSNSSQVTWGSKPLPGDQSGHESTHSKQVTGQFNTNCDPTRYLSS